MEFLQNFLFWRPCSNFPNISLVQRGLKCSETEWPAKHTIITQTYSLSSSLSICFITALPSFIEIAVSLLSFSAPSSPAPSLTPLLLSLRLSPHRTLSSPSRRAACVCVTRESTRVLTGSCKTKLSFYFSRNFIDRFSCFPRFFSRLKNFFLRFLNIFKKLFHDFLNNCSHIIASFLQNPIFFLEKAKDSSSFSFPTDFPRKIWKYFSFTKFLSDFEETSECFCVLVCWFHRKVQKKTVSGFFFEFTTFKKMFCKPSPSSYSF